MNIMMWVQNINCVGRLWSSLQYEWKSLMLLLGSAVVYIKMCMENFDIVGGQC